MREIYIKDQFPKKKKVEIRSVEVGDDEEEAENAFQVQPIENEEEVVEEQTSSNHEPKDLVKVKFEKFVQLVANHDFKTVMQKHPDEDVIVKTDLLADLANAHNEDDGNKNWHIILAAGIILGIIAAYILFKFF